MAACGGVGVVFASYGGMKHSPTDNKATNRTETDAEQRVHVHEILQKMSSVMVLSSALSGPSVMNGRPLHIAKLDDDDTMWFVVGRDSTKVHEIRSDDHVQITGQEGMRWIHLSGVADVVTDRARIQALWNKMHDIWFPDGATDPNVCLLRIRPQNAEYWDNAGVQGIKYFFEAARALLTGTAAKPVKGAHGEITKASNY